MKLRRTLIDNSLEGYNMTEVLKECLKDLYGLIPEEIAIVEGTNNA